MKAWLCKDNQENLLNCVCLRCFYCFYSCCFCITCCLCFAALLLVARCLCCCFYRLFLFFSFFSFSITSRTFWPNAFATTRRAEFTVAWRWRRRWKRLQSRRSTGSLRAAQIGFIRGGCAVAAQRQHLQQRAPNCTGSANWGRLSAGAGAANLLQILHFDFDF